MLTNTSMLSLSQRLYRSIIFFVNPGNLSKTEKCLHLGYEERCSVC
jgi:hypothetical protein